MRLKDPDDPSTTHDLGAARGAQAWRLRHRILAGALVTIVVVGLPMGVAAGAWATHYQPLRAQSLFTYSNASRVESNLTNDSYWRYRRNATVVVGTDMKNTGRTTVTVTGFVAASNADGPIVPIQMRASRDPNVGGLWERAAPVQRVSVHPGERIAFFVEMKMADWTIGRETSLAQSLPVLRVEVLGIHHLLPMSDAKMGVVGPS
jgi:hypothetical protein